MRVFVKNKRNEPLMPCSNKKARQLLKDKKAEIITYNPFTIRLLYATGETNQEDLLGNKLKVGDTVILYCKNRKHGERTICKINNIDFAVGVQNCSFKQGKCDEWSIIKNRSYDKINNSEKVCTTTYILSE